jgi:D-alanine-D-alanine ligase-like ATP-grasp enzyme
MKKAFVSSLLAQLAAEAGLQVNLDPDYQFAGQIVLPNGEKRYFRNTHLDINPLGAAEIAGDKDYAAYFLSLLGYPIVESRKFYSPRWAEIVGKPRQNIDAAYRYARRLGFPVIVKPHNSSQGRGVAKVHTRVEFYRAARRIISARRGRLMLVQRVAEGQDYRIVVLDGEVISAYERIPLSVTGDGRATIRQLLRRKQRQFVQEGRDTQLDLEDFRIAMKLKRAKLTLESKPGKGERIFLLDNANLSTGGDARDVTESMSEAFRQIAINVSRDMNLRYCGVDLITPEPIESPAPQRYTILEINAAPGLDHYARLGQEQDDLVRRLYGKVLQSLAAH